MTATGIGRFGSAPAAWQLSPVLSGLYVIVLVLLLSRIAINGLMLNEVMPYDLDGGSIVEKIHPSVWGFLGVTLFALVAFRAEFDAWETAVLRRFLLLIGCCLAMLVFSAIRGGGGSAGFMIDCYVGACFTALLFLFPQSLRPAAGKVLLIFYAVSAAVGLAEFVLKVRLMPFTETETAFRPTGFSNHPLDLGLWCAVCIPVVAATDWSRGTKIALGVFFIVALAASGARTALVLGAFAALILIVAAIRPNIVPQRRLERRLIVGLAALLSLPAVGAVLYAAGALQRFQSGVDDSNAQARVAIYSVFDGMPWSDILAGPGMDTITRIALNRLHLVAVESPFVIFVAIFGLAWTIIFIGVFIAVVAVMVRRASAAMLLATLLFFAIGLTSNAFATKNPGLTPLFVFLIGFRPKSSRYPTGP